MHVAAPHSPADAQRRECGECSALLVRAHHSRSRMSLKAATPFEFMIGILIIAHGTLGESLIHCASHVLGKRPLRLMQLGVTVQDDPQQILPQALELVRQLDEGDGVLVLTDIYGATPSQHRLQAAGARPRRRRRGRQPADAGPRADLSRRAARRPWSARRSPAASKASCTCPPTNLRNAATGS